MSPTPSSSAFRPARAGPRRAAPALALWATALSSLGACTEPAPPHVVVRAGRLLDGSGEVRERQRIVIDRGTIVRVEPDVGDVPPAPGLVVVDARDATVMPGLVDAHVHLASSGACKAGTGTGLGSALRNLGGLLRAGVTTAADLAAPRTLAVGLRRYAGTGRGRGPRLLVAGPMITARGGYLTDLSGGELVSAGVVVEVSSPEEARARVRSLAEGDVDLVKVGLQETRFDGSPIPLLDQPTLCALVDEAHTQKLRVVAHAVSNRGWRLALDCKVDALGHAPLEPLEPGVAERVAAAGVSVSPTVWVFEAPLAGPRMMARYETPDLQRTLGAESFATMKRWAELEAAAGPSLPDVWLPGLSRERFTRGAAALEGNVRMLAAAGVSLALGTDGGSCFDPLGAPVLELERLVASGLPPRQALAAATAGGARLLGLGDALGRLAPGYRADVVVVDGRPDERIEDVARVRRVIVDGIEQPLDAPRWTAWPAALLAIAGVWLGG